MLDGDFGLNNIISILLGFNDVLFDLSQMFSSFNPHEKINRCLTNINQCLTDIFKI